MKRYDLMLKHAMMAESEDGEWVRCEDVENEINKLLEIYDNLDEKHKGKEDHDYWRGGSDAIADVLMTLFKDRE